MTKVEQYTQEAISIADNNEHGYSQQSRWGPDYDCSSLVIAVVQNAGIPVRSRGASYTGNMRSAFLSCGFQNVTSSCNLSNGSGMQRGDILLNDAAHAAIYIGNGKVVHARTSEGNYMTGDQSGNEIRVQSYWNYPWNCVLRYSGSGSGGGTSTPSGGTPNTGNVLMLRKGSKGAEVKKLQEDLIKLGYDLGSCGADGDFGSKTFMAVLKFQKDWGLEQDGIAGPETLGKIEKVLKDKAKDESSGISVVKELKFKKGETVMFKGGKHYMTATMERGSDATAGKAKITMIFKGKNVKHPYHLVRIAGSKSTVYGWVDEADIEGV